MNIFGKVKIAAAEVLLLAASAAGAPTIVCMDQKNISSHVTANNAIFVSKGTPAPIVIKIAEEFGRSATKSQARG